MAEFYFKEGCFIEEMLNNSDQPQMSIARVRVLVNTTTRLHSLRATTERYVILVGEGVVTIADKSWPVVARDVVTIEAGQGQKIKNTGSEDLVFLAICTPRFLQENYCEIAELSD